MHSPIAFDIEKIVENKEINSVPDEAPDIFSNYFQPHELLAFTPSPLKNTCGCNPSRKIEYQKLSFM